MKKSIPLIMMLAVLSLGACSSDGTYNRMGDDAASECICGTPEADVDGCFCAACANGEGTSVNPLCTCCSLKAEGQSEGGQ